MIAISRIFSGGGTRYETKIGTSWKNEIGITITFRYQRCQRHDYQEGYHSDQRQTVLMVPLFH